MKGSTRIMFLLGLAATGAIIQMLAGIPIFILALAAFAISCLLEMWENRKFNRKLAQMAREVKSRGNGQ